MQHAIIAKRLLTKPHIVKDLFGTFTDEPAMNYVKKELFRVD